MLRKNHSSYHSFLAGLIAASDVSALGLGRLNVTTALWPTARRRVVSLGRTG